MVGYPSQIWAGIFCQNIGWLGACRIIDFGLSLPAKRKESFKKLWRYLNDFWSHFDNLLLFDRFQGLGAVMLVLFDYLNK
jgi:hypothetical protein